MRYYVDTEHVRGERRVYWVADRTSYSGHRFSRGKRMTEPTTDRRKAERQCRELLAASALGQETETP